MSFKPWVLEWGMKSLTALGFKMSEPTDDQRTKDPQASAALGGLVDARQCEGQREGVHITLVAWRYGNQTEAAAAITALSQTSLFAGAVHKMLIGPTVFHLLQSGGDVALTNQVVAAILDYNAVPEGNGKI